MEDNWLQDYIISQTIQSLYYDKDADRYIPDIIHLDESIIQTLVKKIHKKKGLEENEIRQVINDVVQHIDGRPEVVILQNPLDLSQLVSGQILKLVFFSDKFGFCFIEGMLLKAHNQIVILDTDINGLVYADKLVPTISTLQPGYDVTAGILRRDKNLLGKRFIRLPKLQRVELLNPTNVHHIVDKKYNIKLSRGILTTDLLEFAIMLLKEDSKQKDYEDLIELSLSYGLSSFHVNEFIRCAKLFINTHKQNTDKSKSKIEELIQINPLLEDHTLEHEVSKLTTNLAELEKEKDAKISLLQKQIKHSRKVGIGISVFLFLILLISGWHHNETNREYNDIINCKSRIIQNLQSDNQNMTDSVALLRSKVDDMNRTIRNQPSLFVVSIHVANEDEDGIKHTDYGKKIYSSSSMYLHPKLKYYGLVNDKKKIYTKLYTPSGVLSTGTMIINGEKTPSPEGYTYYDDNFVHKGYNEMYLKGWGGKNEGHWNAGTYRYEFYCDGQCIGIHEFTIY